MGFKIKRSAIGPGVSCRFERRQFGFCPDLWVPIISIGTAALGGMLETFKYDISEGQALSTLKVVLTDLHGEGNHLIDTAAAYGESEERIGQAFVSLGKVPPSLIISTKADRDLSTGTLNYDQVRTSVLGSLKRLRVNRVHICSLHDPEHSEHNNPNPTVLVEKVINSGAIQALVDLKKEGLIGHLGISGGPPAMLKQFVTDQRLKATFELVITHNRFNIANSSAADLIHLAHSLGLAVFNAAPFGSGILTKPGKYSKTKAYPQFAYRQATKDMQKRIAALRQICSAYNVPIEAVALRFSVRNPEVTSTIVGVNRPERLASLTELLSIKVPEEIWSEIALWTDHVTDPES